MARADDRAALLNSIIENLQQLTDYNALESVAKVATDMINKSSFGIDTMYEATADGKSIDNSTSATLTNHFQVQMVPASVAGDGICLPRAGSVLPFGHEDSHIEIRTRIIIEMIQNKQLYLNPTDLNKGHRVQKHNPVVQYTMYSDEYVPSQAITCELSDYVYNKEVLSICKPGNFMGIWQLFAIVSVLQRPILSLYPSLGNRVVQKDLNRLIMPSSGE